MNINDAFPSKYLKTEDLKGRDVTVIIDAVDLIQLPNGQGRKLAIQFRGKDKQWIVNKTNANTIAKLLNSGQMEDWIGQQITIYPTETEFQGEMVDCIRVRRDKQAPPPAPPPLDDSEDIPF